MSSYESVTFFTAISHPNNWAMDTVEDYFHLGHLSGRKVVVLNKDAVSYKSEDESPAYLFSVLKIASYLTIVIPLVMLAAKTYLRSLNSFRIINGGLSHARIEACWKQHVLPFTIKHGTTSLYVKHFQKHGISATYPEPLHGLIAKIRGVWADHADDVTPKTGYFTWFENRYDEAQRNKKIAVSFTADTFRTDEYTTGARGHGGEWIREVRTFLRHIPNDEIFSCEEKKTIDEIRAFDELLRKLPPMTVAIRGGSQALVTALGRGILLPMADFKNLITSKCPEWHDVTKLDKYLDDDFIPRLKSVTESYQSQYEVTVFNQIDPSGLEIEILGQKRDEEAPAKDYPQLAFNSPTRLSYNECMKLHIHQETNTSSLAAYSDSQFEVRYDDGAIILTRKQLSEQVKAKILAQNERKKLQYEWLQAFECPELARYI